MKMPFTLLLTLSLFTYTAMSETLNLDTAAQTGKPTADWTATMTGKGHAKWIFGEKGEIKQTGEADYPLCLKNGTALKDGFVSVKFKTVSGKEDQAGGVVWRARDANNYYIARANALEDNVRIYHFVNGKRTQFKGANLKVAPGQWHTLRVEFKGNQFTVLFNGQKVIEATDDTHTAAGQVGLWTKADSVTLFNDFTYGGK